MSLLWKTATDMPLIHVPAAEVPVADNRDTGPHIKYHVAEDDPPTHPALGLPDATYSWRMEPIERLWPSKGCPGGRHGSHCYEKPTPGHDVYEGNDFDDADFVRQMSTRVDSLPAVLVTKEHGIFGGGHRLAAASDAGRTHYQAWVQD